MREDTAGSQQVTEVLGVLELIHNNPAFAR